MFYVMFSALVITTILVNTVAGWLLLREVYRYFRDKWRKKYEIRRL